jgi:tRNA (guanine-N7-)-methyltransferase|tara:strand:+ start:22200 stop:22790 length:591 start_codon:yes stop_codon:yes gene_type:complete
MNLKIYKYKQNYLDISKTDEIIKLNSEKNIILDIGSGEGEFLTELAIKNKNELHIGIEIKYGRIIKSLKRVDKIGLKNIKFIYGDINPIVESIFYSNNIKNIYINNPDPWPKDRHIKNRIIKSNLLNKLFQILIRNGEMIIKTDSSEYLEYMKKEINESKFKKWKSYKKNSLPLTKFQKDFKNTNKEIYALYLTKN